MFYKAIVIGTGPSGLFVANCLSSTGINTLLLEKNKKLGRKLLASGSGQCNLTNSGNIESFFDKYGDNNNFIKNALLKFTNNDTLEFFKSLNVELEITQAGKVFPKNRDSTEILDALVKSNKLNGTHIKSGVNIDKILEYDGIFYISFTTGESYTTENLIIATGGVTYPHLGTDGFGHKIALQFGHTITEINPALTNIITQEDAYKTISGVSFDNVSMTIWRDNKKVKTTQGDLLFTHKGVSGPVILNSSRWIRKGDVLKFNLVNQLYEDVTKILEQDFRTYGKEQIITYIKRFNLPKSFVQVMFSQLNIDYSINCASISKGQRKNLALFLTHMPLTVKKLGDMAMVTSGGVNLKEINATSFESRKQKNLYFIGEVLDIDGDTGGYNIQAAFSMAYTCATYISRRN
ncbi:MAG: hypothetical protein BEN19_06870 [Epulopiscium sp. Nuni2H_MBin003]|nr:MAG: hypothetical protein BEN19_06870 [Epulopiscium sp. Nuni2H_MBin003]